MSEWNPFLVYFWKTIYVWYDLPWVQFIVERASDGFISFQILEIVCYFIFIDVAWVPFRASLVHLDHLGDTRHDTVCWFQFEHDLHRAPQSEPYLAHSASFQLSLDHQLPEWLAAVIEVRKHFQPTRLEPPRGVFSHHFYSVSAWINATQQTICWTPWW